jgi:hypothetical protein
MPRSGAFDRASSRLLRASEPWSGHDAHGMSFAHSTDTMSTESVVRLDAIGAEVRIGVHLDVNGRRDALPGGAPHAGQVIGGRYELVRVIGRGSMGAVWLASHRGLGEQVALKLLSATDDTAGIEDASMTGARFRFEAQVAARLSRRTPHIVRVTDYGQEGARAYLVMELLEGETLEMRLIRRGPMEAGDVAKLVTQIARGLEIAHTEGVLHRDLKPANIFLARSEDGELLVKLLDFGVARPSAPHGLDAPFATGRGVVVGTPGYMSPEQASGAAGLDGRADLWSLAAVAYEALTGEVPVDGASVEEMLGNLRAGRIVPLRARRPELHGKLGRFFDRAFAPRVEDRHASCSELARAFEGAASGARAGRGEARTPVTMRLRWRAAAVARPAAAAPPGAHLRHRARTVLSVAAAAVAMLAALFGTWHASDRSTAVAAAQAGTTLVATPGTERPVPTATAPQGDPNAIPASETIAPAPLDEPQAASKSARSPSDKAPRAQPYDYGEFSTYF